MSDRGNRVVSDLNSRFLNEQAVADVARLGIELHDGGPLTVCDYDTLENGDPAWLVVEGVIRFDPDRQQWWIDYTMDDAHWEPRESAPPSAQ